jgi:hypothetical protein
MKDFILKIKGLINENKQLTSTVLKGVLAIIVFIISVGIFLVYLENKEEVKVDNDTEIEEEIENEDIDDEINEEVDEKDSNLINWKQFQEKYNLTKGNYLELEKIYQNEFVTTKLFKTMNLVNADENYTFNLRIPSVSFSDEFISKMELETLKYYNDAIEYNNKLIEANLNNEDYGGNTFLEIDYYTYSKDNLISIVTELYSGIWASEPGYDYSIYNLDGNAKKSITDDELLAKFNINREDFNSELVKKVRYHVFYQIFEYNVYDENGETEGINESDVINKYNEEIAKANTWRIFIDQDQDLSVMVPLAYNSHQQPFFIKVIDNI